MKLKSLILPTLVSLGLATGTGKAQSVIPPDVKLPQAVAADMLTKTNEDLANIVTGALKGKLITAAGEEQLGLLKEALLAFKRADDRAKAILLSDFIREQARNNNPIKYAFYSPPKKNTSNTGAACKDSWGQMSIDFANGLGLRFSYDYNTNNTVGIGNVDIDFAYACGCGTKPDRVISSIYDEEPNDGKLAYTSLRSPFNVYEGLKGPDKIGHYNYLQLPAVTQPTTTPLQKTTNPFGTTPVDPMTKVLWDAYQKANPKATLEDFQAILKQAYKDAEAAAGGKVIKP